MTLRSPFENALLALQREERYPGLHQAAQAYIDTASPEEISEYQNRPRPVIVQLSSIKVEPIRWLWRGYLAEGKLSLIIGDPGTGKSTLAEGDIASRISRGARWPDGSPAEIGNVIVLSAEDGLADTVRPRIDVHDGDPARVYAFQAIKVGDDERPFSLSNDLPCLEDAIEEIGAVRLVIIDPVSAYLGNRDSYKDSEIRTVLAPLAALAERRNVSVIAVAHLGKSEQRKALYRALGSIGFVAAARSVFAVGRDPENPDRRLFVCVKNNMAVFPEALAFSIVEKNGQGALTWEPGPVSGVDADSVLSSTLSPTEREERLDVEEFLTEVLADGRLSANEVRRAVEQNGFSWPTVKRAKRRLGIEAIKVGQPGEKGQWFWHLPKGITNGTNLGSVIPFDQTKDTKAINSATCLKEITNSHMIPFGDPLRSAEEEETI